MAIITHFVFFEKGLLDKTEAEGYHDFCKVNRISTGEPVATG